MPHDDQARERMLRAVYTDQVLTMGLARDSVEDEESDSDYARISITFGEPQVGDDGRIFVSNVEDVQLRPYAQDAEKPVKYWLLFDVRGERLAFDRITRPGANEPRPVLPQQGEAPIFPAGEIRVGLR